MVTVTVYVPAVFTDIDCVVAPLIVFPPRAHANVHPAPGAGMLKVDVPHAFETVITGVAGIAFGTAVKLALALQPFVVWVSV